MLMSFWNIKDLWSSAVVAVVEVESELELVLELDESEEVDESLEEVLLLTTVTKTKEL